MTKRELAGKIEAQKAAVAALRDKYLCAVYGAQGGMHRARGAYSPEEIIALAALEAGEAKLKQLEATSTKKKK